MIETIKSLKSRIKSLEESILDLRKAIEIRDETIRQLKGIENRQLYKDSDSTFRAAIPIDSAVADILLSHISTRPKQNMP